MTWLVSNIKLNKLEWFSVVDKGASGNKKHPTKIVLWKRAQPSISDRIKSILQKMGKPIDVKKQEPAMPTLEEILAKLTPEEQKIIMDALAATATSAPKPVVSVEPEPEPKPEELQKRLKDEIEKLEDGSFLRVQLEKQLSDIEKFSKENFDLQKRLEDLEERSRMIAMEKRVEDLSFLPIAKLDLAKTLISVQKAMSEDQYKVFDEMLAKINKAMKDSPIFTEYGTSQTNGEETAIQKRDKLVLELRKKNPTLKERQARLHVYRANPGLSAEIQAEENAH